MYGMQCKQLTSCHCTGCKNHYKRNNHVFKAAATCGKWCRDHDVCRFLLHNSVTHKCHLYNSTAVSGLKFENNGDSRYTCFTKVHLEHGVAKEPI